VTPAISRRRLILVDAVRRRARTRCLRTSAGEWVTAPPRADGRIGKRRTSTEGAVIRGFHLPRGLTGRVLLAELQEAYHLDPATGRLPGAEPEYRLPHALRTEDLGAALLGSAPGDADAGNLRQDAELLRELRRLTSTKGAPGSTRSMVGWCSYRLRHATTSGLVERVALSGYRVLGYGERSFASPSDLAVLHFHRRRSDLG